MWTGSTGQLGHPPTTNTTLGQGVLQALGFTMALPHICAQPDLPWNLILDPESYFSWPFRIQKPGTFAGAV